MTYSKTIILFLPLFFLMNKVMSQRDSTYFTYDSFSPTTKNLIYQGDAFVPSTFSFARLTKVNADGKPSALSVGRVLYSPPVMFWEPSRQASFETTIKFNITPVDNNPGDGLTFFIIPVDSPIPNPSTGGNFGLFDLYTGVAPSSVFAVEFDIFYEGDNAKWDPPYRHIGIDINSRVSKKVSRFKGALGQEVTARINYGAWSKTVNVWVTYGSVVSTLTYTYDLKTVLPQAVQVGISAATGASVAFHDLNSWYFESNLFWEDDVVGINNTYIPKYV